ncbi:uncharacterized protein LOC143225462 isoform X3 [Tachypleus tridentatus]|uniref:uncharacterized protein LOC143225462 isoform X3 n=1 Tax=Tachypleus tridentatus TaxID=6853 RepID=UPI003FD67675
MLTKGYTVTIFCAMATLLLIYSVETTASSFPRYYYPNTSMSANSTENNSRKARFFSIFTLAVFENDACNTSSINRTGICFSARECVSRGGRAEGACAGGYGVCCLFEISCDSNSSNNSTYFQNPNFPTTYTESRTCLASFRKVHSNICQFRLDFISFDIGKPTSGMCNEDRLIISGQSQNSVVPPLCGFNTGQHLYLEVSGTEGPIQLNVISQGNRARSFDIRVTQISCDSRNLALQYFILRFMYYDTFWMSLQLIMLRITISKSRDVYINNSHSFSARRFIKVKVNF